MSSLFHRLQLETWLHTLPQIALWIFLIVFLVGVLRTFLLPKDRIQHLESLPLDDNPRHEH